MNEIGSLSDIVLVGMRFSLLGLFEVTWSVDDKAQLLLVVAHSPRSRGTGHGTKGIRVIYQEQA